MNGMARTSRYAIALATVLVATLGLTTSSAFATSSYTYAGTFTTGESPVFPFGACNVRDLDIDAQENVYVLCGGPASINGSGGTIIKKYDKIGNPVPFTASTSYVSGNAITEVPDPGLFKKSDYGRTLEGRDTIVVDRSSSGTAGYIYIVKFINTVEVFDPTGKWVGTIPSPAAFGVTSGAVDLSGNLYVNSQFKVNKFDPAWTLRKQLYVAASNSEYNNVLGSNGLAVDSTGAVWGAGSVADGFPSGVFYSGSVAKIEADQFGEPEIESTFALGSHKKATLSPLGNWPLAAFASASPFMASGIDVDMADDSLVAQGTGGIYNFSAGTLHEPSHQVTPTIGNASQVGSGASGNDGLAIGWADRVIYVAKDNGVSRFVPGPPVPTAHTDAAQVEDIGHNSVVVRGSVEVAGGGPVVSCEVRYGLTQQYGASVPCSPDPAASSPGSNFTEDTTVSATLPGLFLGSTYHYAFVASNAAGSGLGVDRTAQTVAVLNLRTEAASDVDDQSATLNGSFDPDGMSTDYRFEYGLAGEMTQSTSPVAPITGSGVQDVSIGVENLRAGAVYSYRLVATNELGTTRGPVRTVRVAGPPSVLGVRATNVGATQADLNARINPVGYPTTYRFEYGPTKNYGSTVPIPPEEGDAGEATTAGEFIQHVEGLQPGVVYHFRVVATNQWGTALSGDTTFNFAPQPCPNEHVRQVTKSSYLPDCRAYEIVSPESAGGVQIYPGNETDDYGFAFGFNGPLAYKYVLQNTGLAQSPSRFMFYAGLGSVDGINTPNVALESYVSTRTNDGWVTTYPGLKGSEGGENGHKVCSLGFEYCVDHPVSAFTSTNPQNSGYLFDVNGTKVGSVPSNFKAIQGGEMFTGDWEFSPRFDKFVFSSLDVPFAPGGIREAPGSAYSNDLSDHSISLISRLPNGDAIGSDSSDTSEFILFPPNGISHDGSHVLMLTEASNGPHHLYMRVNNAVTHDIANGAGVRYIGMSRDGETVLFLATQRLVAGDTDESADIYRWKENAGAPALSLVTQANGAAASDECNASWTARCSAQLLDTERDETTGYTGPLYEDVIVPGTDTKYGAESGSVLFFSPEDLDGAAPLNGRNLYLAHDGEIQYLATFGSEQGVDRVQVSPNGSRVGLLTETQLTSYDNDGHRQMYTYDAETRELVCASCNPSGLPPLNDVEASQNGPFMSDDGRVFFSTADPLVPTDVDVLRLPDVYEYVEGRPQLISSGGSMNAKAPGGAALFVAKTLGLEAVSANGVDVYFSTTDTLVPQDVNGRFAKIYNARTNGGFLPDEEPVPCVAADECHGTGAAAPAPLQVGTGARLNGGNVSDARRRPRRNAKSRKRCARRRNSRRASRRSGKAAKRITQRSCSRRGRRR